MSEYSILAVPVSASDHAQGDAAAAVTLVEYGDYQCPACGAAYPMVKKVQRHYAGNLRFVFRNFPLIQAHPFARLAAEIAEAAAILGRFWVMHDWLYENQAQWVSTGSAGLETGLGALDVDKVAFAKAARSPEIDARIRRDFMGGARSGVNGTPSFYVNGFLHQGDYTLLARTIGKEIAKQQR